MKGWDFGEGDSAPAPSPSTEPAPAAAPPRLTDVQHLRLEVLVLKRELADLRLSLTPQAHALAAADEALRVFGVEIAAEYGIEKPYINADGTIVPRPT